MPRRRKDDRVFRKRPNVPTLYGIYYDLAGQRHVVCLKTEDRTEAILKLRALAREAASGVPQAPSPR